MRLLYYVIGLLSQVIGKTLFRGLGLRALWGYDGRPQRMGPNKLGFYLGFLGIVIRLA